MACGDGCEAEPVEESVGQRDAERRAETDPPRAMGAARGLGRQRLLQVDPAAATTASINGCCPCRRCVRVRRAPKRPLRVHLVVSGLDKGLHPSPPAPK